MAHDELMQIINERDTAIIERDKFREENRRLCNKIVETPILWDELDELAEEVKRLRAALNMLKTSIEQDPTRDSQVNNWMLGIIDTALGETAV